MGNCVNIDAPVSRGTPPPTDWHLFCLNVTSSLYFIFKKMAHLSWFSTLFSEPEIWFLTNQFYKYIPDLCCMVWNIQVQMKLNPNDPPVEFISFFLWNPWKNFNSIKFERVDSKEKLGISSWEMKTDALNKTIEHIKKSFRDRQNPIFETGPLHWSRSKWPPFFICFN